MIDINRLREFHGRMLRSASFGIVREVNEDERIKETLAVLAMHDFGPHGDVDRPAGVYMALRPDGTEAIVRFFCGELGYGCYDIAANDAVWSFGTYAGWRIAKAALIGGEAGK